MTRNLFLLRHAKATSGHSGLRDRDRSLSVQGQSDALAMGRYMTVRDIVLDLVLCSPARRTAETLTLLRAGFDHDPEMRFVERFYPADAETLLDEIQNISAPWTSVLVVAHNPGIAELAAWLVASRAQRQREYLALSTQYPACGLTWLTFSGDSWGDVQPGEGALCAFTTPGNLDVAGADPDHE